MAKTVIHTQENIALFGENDHLEVAQKRSFSSLIFELLCERAPEKGEEEIFELILNISIDHGPDTPSAIKTIEAAKSGKTISESVAAGVLEINDIHGGAQEQLMELIYRIKKGKTITAQELVKEYIESGKKLPGFGHRIYKDVDPRAEIILSKMKGIYGVEEYSAIADEIKYEIERQTGKKLPINVDGAIAVALCSFGWEPKLGKAVFIVARTPGLCGQFLSEA